jgi:peptidoglycan/LPS O-acetylase OafA/YrhL
MRNGLIDCAKYIAAIGIVLFHLKLPGGSIGLSALSFFTVILTYHGAIAANRPSLQDYADKLNLRIMWPWTIWSVIYLCAKLINAQVDHLPFSTEFDSWMWWTGPALHLWFLPFAFTASLIVWSLPTPTKVSPTLYFALTLSLFILCIACFYFATTYQLGIPWAQWNSVLPAAFMGVALAAAQRSKSRLTILICTILAAYFIGRMVNWGWAPFQFFIGSLAAMATVLWNPGCNRMTTWLGAVSLGVYLTHPLCVAILNKVLTQNSTWEKFFLTVILATMLAEIYRRFEILLLKRASHKQLTTSSV